MRARAFMCLLGSICSQFLVRPQAPAELGRSARGGLMKHEASIRR